VGVPPWTRYGVFPVDAPRAARVGAVSFVQRFGSALNVHTHLHCSVTDGGFALHPAVFIEAADRPGLEPLLRYCAGPVFASKRLCWSGSDQPVRYSLTKPLPTGQTKLTLTCSSRAARRRCWSSRTDIVVPLEQWRRRSA